MNKAVGIVVILLLSLLPNKSSAESCLSIFNRVIGDDFEIELPKEDKNYKLNLKKMEIYAEYDASRFQESLNESTQKLNEVRDSIVERLGWEDLRLIYGILDGKIGPDNVKNDPAFMRALKKSFFAHINHTGGQIAFLIRSFRLNQIKVAQTKVELSETGPKGIFIRIWREGDVENLTRLENKLDQERTFRARAKTELDRAEQELKRLNDLGLQLRLIETPLTGFVSLDDIKI